MLEILNLFSFTYLAMLVIAIHLSNKAISNSVSGYIASISFIVMIFVLLILTSMLWMILLCVHFLPIIVGLLSNLRKLKDLRSNTEILYWSAIVIFNGYEDGIWSRIKTNLGIGLLDECFCTYRDRFLKDQSPSLAIVLELIEEEVVNKLPTIKDEEIVNLSYSNKERLLTRFLAVGYYARCSSCHRSKAYYKFNNRAFILLEDMLKSNRDISKLTQKELCNILRIVRSYGFTIDEIRDIANRINKNIPWDFIC